MATYAYCRVSTIDQADKGNSLDVQRERQGGAARARVAAALDCWQVVARIS